MPPMDAETLRQYLEFYQDLGIKTLYRHDPPAASQSPVIEAAAAPVANVAPAAPVIAAPAPTPPDIAMELPPLAPKDDTLLKIMEDIGDCRRCRLCEGRQKVVF